MSIRKPETHLSAADKRLLVLLAKLLTDEGQGSESKANVADGLVTLSNEEAEQLASLLESLASSRAFIESAYFVEELGRLGPDNEWRLRELFLHTRKKRGRQRAMGSKHWSDFQIRLGLREVKGSEIKKMPFEHFLLMERRLLLVLGINPRVIAIVDRLIDGRRAAIERMRAGQRQVRAGTIPKEISDTAKTLRSTKSPRVASRTVSTQRLAAILTLVADFGVLFSSRDWGVSGTISTMAGALVLASGD